ncbi:MAG: YkgJ family cysteine cluster protein [Rhodospirillales bacterium]|nr:YkgJ family cysteine cluster protein [Rhodospirillales bacterium]
MTGSEYDLEHLAQKTVADRLGMVRTEATLAETHRALVQLYEELTAILLDKVPPDRPFACKSGCSFCCAALVAVSPLEAIALARHLATRPDWASRLRALAGQNPPRDVAGWWRARLACPFLDKKNCAVYAQRPLSCRAVLSPSRTRCESLWKHRERAGEMLYYHPTVEARRKIGFGVREGLKALGLDGADLALVPAVALILDDPSLIARFLAGEAVFAPARAVESP